MPATLRLLHGDGEELSADVELQHLLDNLDFTTVASWTERGPRFVHQISRFRLRDGSRLSPAEAQLLRDMLLSHYQRPSSQRAEEWRQAIETTWANYPYVAFGHAIQFQPDRQRCDVLANANWLEDYWCDWREPHAPTPALPWPRHADGTIVVVETGEIM